MVDIISHIPFDKIGWTVLHFVWISTIFLGITALVLKSVEKPFLRYRFAQGTLILLLILPIALWMEKPEPVPDTNPTAQVSNRSSLLPENETTTTSKNINPPNPIEIPNKTAEKEQDESFSDDLLTQLTNIDIQPFYSWIGGFWFIGGILMQLYLIGGLVLIRRKNRRYRPLNSARWQTICRQLKRKLGLTDHIQLLSSDQINTPCVVGFTRPSVWIPSRLADQLDDSEIKALLAHELVHIKRHDYLAGLIQQMALTILFMQPLVWWLIKKLQQEREFICDEESATLHQNRYHYASTLVQIKKNYPGRLNRAPIGVNATGHQLVKRIRRLTTLPDENSGAFHPTKMYSLILLMLLSVFGMGWTSYQLDYQDKPGITIELDERIPNPYNGGGMAVLLPWNRLAESKRNAAVLPDLAPGAQKSVARIKFTGNSNAQNSDEVLALFVNPTTDAPDVYVDKNQNLDFTDDGGRHTFSNSELTVEFPNNGVSNAKHVIRWSKMEQSKIDALQERPNHWTNQYSYITIIRNERLNHSSGRWSYDDKTYSFTLIDRNLNGVFGEMNTGFLAINNAEQESLEERKSYYLNKMPALTLGSARFKVVEINPDGTELRIKKVK